MSESAPDRDSVLRGELGVSSARSVGLDPSTDLLGVRVTERVTAHIKRFPIGLLHYPHDRPVLRSWINEQLAAAGYVTCAICAKRMTASTEVCIDHDHTSGSVRGFLCADCNRGLGSFRDDMIRVLWAYLYLRYAPDKPDLKAILGIVDA